MTEPRDPVRDKLLEHAHEIRRTADSAGSLLNNIRCQAEDFSCVAKHLRLLLYQEASLLRDLDPEQFSSVTEDMIDWVHSSFPEIMECRFDDVISDAQYHMDQIQKIALMCDRTIRQANIQAPPDFISSREQI